MSYLRTGMLLRAKREIPLYKPTEDGMDLIEAGLKPGDVVMLAQMSGEQSRYSILELSLLVDSLYYYQAAVNDPWQRDFEVLEQQ